MSIKGKNAFWYSLLFHVFILAVFIISFETTSLLPVFENTNQRDAISAVVLGDIPTSKMLPQKLASDLPKPVVEKTPPPAPKVLPKPDEKEAIALSKPLLQKKVVDQKKEAEKKLKKALEKNLLADIKTAQDKKAQPQKIQNNFKKLLQQQAEKSLRQQLLNEEIKLQGSEMKQSQGVVDKYKALILQVISTHWIVPMQSKKNISAELMIRLAPGGVVLDVQISKSSGDLALDSSARAAVLQSSPLPVPADPKQFEPFRQFLLKVKPENLQAV